jgi:hypothetical protein
MYDYGIISTHKKVIGLLKQHTGLKATTSKLKANDLKRLIIDHVNLLYQNSLPSVESFCKQAIIPFVRMDHSLVYTYDASLFSNHTLEITKDAETLSIHDIGINLIKADNPFRIIKSSVYIKYLATKYLISKQKYTDFNLGLFCYFIARYLGETSDNCITFMQYNRSTENIITTTCSIIKMNIPENHMKYLDKLEIEFADNRSDTGMSSLMQTLFTCIENDKKNNIQPSGA